MRRRSLVGLAALALVVALVPGLPWAEEGQKTVKVTFDYGNGTEKTVAALPWRAGMTVWDATLEAARRSPASTVNHRGRGDSAFVTEIDGVKNQGGGGEGKNWQYWVDGKYAEKGAGASPLSAGSHVVWKFTSPPDGWK